MNNVDLLTAQVELHPDNPIVAAMLLDELMEARDMHRSEAEAHVKRIQEVAIDAAFLRRAAEITGGCPWQRAWVRDTVLEHIQLPVGAEVVVMLAPGLNPPAHHYTVSPNNECLWTPGTVTVGGQWLVREYREMLAWRRIGRRETRESKRK